MLARRKDRQMPVEEQQRTVAEKLLREELGGTGWI
jgi:hypothetical protein